MQFGISEFIVNFTVPGVHGQNDPLYAQYGYHLAEVFYFLVKSNNIWL